MDDICWRGKEQLRGCLERPGMVTAAWNQDWECCCMELRQRIELVHV